LHLNQNCPKWKKVISRLLPSRTKTFSPVEQVKIEENASLIHGAEKMKRNQSATNYRRISWPMEISVANWPTFFPEKERRKVLDRPRVSTASRSFPLLCE